jgi:hypothetical protein
MNQDQQREFFSKSFTLQGRMFFPDILKPAALTPDQVAAGKKPKYKIMFSWPKNSNQAVMQELANFITQAKEAFHPSIPWTHFVNPVKDFDTYVRQDGKPNHEFTRDSYWVNASTGFAPVVVGPDRQPVINEADVYSGRNCVVNISFFNLDGSGGGKRGLSTNIQAVMLLDGGSREGGGGQQVDPNAVFGQFQVDMGLVNQGGQAPAPGQQAPMGGQAFGNPMGQQAPQQQAPMQQAPMQQAPMQQDPMAGQQFGQGTPQTQMPQYGQQAPAGQGMPQNTNQSPFGV